MEEFCQQNMITKPWETLNKLDDTLGQDIKLAEKKISKLPKPPYSLTLYLASMKAQQWFTQQSQHLTQVDHSRVLADMQSHLKLVHPEP